MDRIVEFTNNHMLLVAGLLVSFFMLIFSEMRRKASGLINIEASEAVNIINNEATVIDIRNPESYARGHIVNARNIPLDQLEAKTDQLDKSKPILAVCDAGISSTRAVNALRKSGFESAYGIKGGMNGWSQAGLPVVTGKKTKSRNKGKK